MNRDDLIRALRATGYASNVATADELERQDEMRQAGITYKAVRAILADCNRDDGDSFGRTVERLRDLATKPMRDERRMVVRYLSGCAPMSDMRHLGELIERGCHRVDER